MGVEANGRVVRAYYSAYPIGLSVSFCVYWVANWFYAPPLRYPLSEWHEPKNYVRPKQRSGGLEVDEGGVEKRWTSEAGEKGVGENGVTFQAAWFITD